MTQDHPRRSGSHAIVVALAWSVVALLAGCADPAGLPTTPPQPGTAPTPSVVNVVPTAQFAVTPRWPAPGDTVTFDARYSHDDDGQVVQYRWVASNGVTLTSGAVVREVFRTAGTYSVTLTTVDDHGDSSRTTLTLPISASGAPVGAVSATQSSLTLASATVAGGANVLATVTARTAAGLAISGAPVGVSARGLRVRASPAAGTASGIGVFTANLSSGVAQSVIVRAVADFTALVDTVPLTIVSAPVRATSAVRVTQQSFLVPSDSALVEVTAVDSAGNPVSGVPVTISGSPAGLVVLNEGITDASGRRVITVRSSGCSVAHVLTITAGGVVLSAAPVITASASLAYGVCGAALWLDASDSSTMTQSGGIVTAWRDRSAYARHTAPSAGPLVVPSAMNGLTAFRFNGASQVVPIADVVSGTPYSVFAIARRRAASAFVLGGTSTATNADLHLGWRTSTVASLGHYFNDINGTIPAFTSIAAEPVRLLSGRWTSGARSLRIDASTILSDATTSGVTSWAGSSIGSLNGGYQSLDVGEVLFFTRALSDVDRLLVEHGLMRKWGLGTVTITQGNNQSTRAGTSPTSQLGFNVGDAQGNPIADATLTLQVSTGGGRLSGATTLTLTTDSNGNASVPTGSWILDYGANVITVWRSATAGQGQSVTLTGTGTLPSNLVMQYDASDAGTLYRSSTCTGTIAAVGDSVGCWLDNSSNARHVTQSTAANRPTVTTFGSTGRTALQFVRTRENFLVSTAAGLGDLGDGPRTIVAVARANTTEDNGTNNASTVVAFPSSNISGLSFSGYPSVSVVAATQTTSLGVQANPTHSYTPGSAAVLSQVVSVSLLSFTSTVGVNGSTASSSGLGLSLGYPDVMRIGQSFVSPTTSYRRRLDGQIAEVMLFSRALTNTERLQVERYMGWKWGVTVP